jgi:hypothetical protein
LKKSKNVELSVVLAQVGEEGTLKLDDYILHLLAGHAVAIFEPAAELTGIGIPLCRDLFFPTPQRPIQIVGGCLGVDGLGTTMFPPLFLDGSEELVAILVGGDDW